MHVLYLVTIILVIVAIIWFGMPWVFQTIHEPFQGCTTDQEQLSVTPATPADDWTSYIERGKQVYNYLGYPQTLVPDAERAFKDRIATDADVQALNEDIRKALTSVDMVADTTAVPGTAKPVVSMSPTGVATLENGAAVFDPANNWNQRKATLNYVEERVPGTNLSTQQAERCEAVNLYTTVSAGGEIQSRTPAFKRTDLCNMLGTRNVTTGEVEGLDPSLAGCGVCVKDGSPVSTSEASSIWRNRFTAAVKFIGGMLFTNADRDAYEASRNPSATPSLGECAPGYFFVAGEKDKCRKAVNRLNCEEYGTNGGFGEGQTLDGLNNTQLSQTCAACPQGSSTSYIYNTDRRANIRLRITVPKGTGMTRVSYAQQAVGAVGFGSRTEYTIQNSNTYTNADGELAFTSVVFPLSNANPEDTVLLEVFQQFPHRPRGDPEVFLVYFDEQSTQGFTFDQYQEFAISLAASINCTVASFDQLNTAYTRGAQVGEAGFVQLNDGSLQAYTCHQYDDIRSDSNIYPNPNKLGVVSANEYSGFWCYGVKPRLPFLKSYAIGADTNAAPRVANFYTYLPLNNEDGLAQSAKTSRFSEFGNDYRTPQYRGICVQFESTNDNDPRSTLAEPFLLEVNNQTIRNADGSLATQEPLSIYSRNGTFADSQRIVEPKPTSNPYFAKVLANQYWLWSFDHQDSGFKLVLKVPGVFNRPYYDEDLSKCSGPLYISRDMLNFVEYKACADGLNLQCMQTQFSKVGTSDGTWYPSGEDSVGYQTMLYKDSRKTIQRTPEELMVFLAEEKKRAMGTSDSLVGMSPAMKVERMNESSRHLIGRAIVSDCETLVSNTDGSIQILNQTGTLDAKCLDELYRKTYSDSGTPTYQSIGDRYSGIRKDELVLDDTRNAFPYRTCQPGGSWAPIRMDGEVNLDAVAQINQAISNWQSENSGLDSVQAAQAVFNNIYQTANTSADKQAQQVAMERCYGVVKKEYVSNCQGIQTVTIRFLNLTGGKNDTPTNSIVTSVELPQELVNQTIVQLLGSDRVLTQRFATSSPVEFNQIDLTPVLAYKDLVYPAGGQRIRLESLISGYFLAMDGSISNTNTETTFLLRPRKSTGASVGAVGAPGSAESAKIYSLESTKVANRFLARSSTGVQITQLTTVGTWNFAVNADWTILPALNGASAFVSLQLTNSPTYYLLAEIQNGTIVPICKELLNPTDLDLAKACWRLYPSDV